jgi:hypothetical protein
VVASVQGRFDVPVAAWLMPEPENAHDPSAVMVWTLGGKVGYLPRELAQIWQPLVHVPLCTLKGPPVLQQQGTGGRRAETTIDEGTRNGDLG